MRGFRIGNFELFWLNGGTFELDGGAMFGVVPKVSWQKKYTPDSDNYVFLVPRPMPIIIHFGSWHMITSPLIPSG